MKGWGTAWKVSALMTAVAVIAAVMLFIVLPSGKAIATNTTYYIDAVNGDDGNDGQSQNSAWKTISKANMETFSAGDQILLKRGQTFTGSFDGQGSGTSDNPIILGAYGTGSKPIIEFDQYAEYGIRLYNVSYWEVSDLEVKGPGKGVGTNNKRGIYVLNDQAATVNGIHILNTSVHDIGSEAESSGTGGIIFRSTATSTSKFNDILIDGATVYSTKQWRGIYVDGANHNQTTVKSTNVIIRNSTVYDVWGDGIHVIGVDGGMIENSVAYDNGSGPSGIGPTPVAIWSWLSNDFVIRNCEAYNQSSFAYDGGGFDIDYYNTNGTVEYSYAHDNDGYGVSIFGADSKQFGGSAAVTENSTIRYNIFSNNGRLAGDDGAGQGEIYLATWDNGSIGSFKIYNNTSYWSPNTSSTYGAVLNDKGSASSFSGTNNRIFKNNLIYSDVDKMVNLPSDDIDLDHNLYYSTSGSYDWTYNGTTYTSFGSYQSGSGQDANSIVDDPLLNSPTYHGTGKPTTAFTLQSGSPAINAGTDVGDSVDEDFFGNSIQDGSVDIGAHEYQGGGTVLFDDNFNSMTTGNAPTGWTLSSNANTSVTVEDTPGSVNKSMKLTDNNTSDRVWGYRSFTAQSSEFHVEFSLMTPNTGKWSGFYVKDGPTFSVKMYLDCNNNLIYNDNTGTSQIVQYIDQDTWYDIKLDIDPSTDTFDIYVNNTLKKSGATFRNAVWSLNTVSFETNSGYTDAFYLDNVKVYTP